MSSIFRALEPSPRPLPVFDRETTLKGPLSSIALITSLSLIVVCLAIMAGLSYHHFSDLLFC